MPLSALVTVAMLSAGMAEPGATMAEPMRIQILLAEVSLTRLHAEGEDPATLIHADRSAEPRSEADRLFDTAPVELLQTVVGENHRLLGRVRSWQDEGWLEVLARPTLTTTIGRPTFVHVGGEFPVACRADGTVGVEFREYGARIDLIPVGRDHDAVDLQIRTRLSELDPSRAIKIGDSTVPGLLAAEFDSQARLLRNEVLVVMGSTRSKLVIRDDRNVAEERVLLLLVRIP